MQEKRLMPAHNTTTTSATEEPRFVHFEKHYDAYERAVT